MVDKHQTQPDPESTLVHKPQAEPDPEATWTGAPPELGEADRTLLDAAVADGDPEVTLVVGLRPGVQPAADPEATVVYRAHAGESPGAEASVATPLQGLRQFQARGEPVAADLEFLVGLNPLVAAANRVLSAVPQIRSSLKHPDPGALRAELLGHVGKFAQTAPVKGYDADTVAVARYALCALVDESVLNTPWAGAAQWDRQGLLRTLYDEDEGSERFFAALSRMAESPAANIDVLEFFDVCLALGFEGQFRSAAGGRAQLELVRARLKDMIRRERAAASVELSERWRGLEVPIRRGSNWFVVWVCACACAAILVASYLGFRVLLGTASEPAARALARLHAPSAPAVAKPGPPAVAKPGPPARAWLRNTLAQEIDGGLVTLQEDGQQSVVTIKGDELFASGSASIDARYIPVVQRVAQALNNVPGPVIVTGHTDDVPIRTARFPSNWELSRERALSVAKLMAGDIADKERLRTEGLADSEPLAPNDSAANRAKNRRVTIILKVLRAQ
jgi:type VI secretion system protein ImpK